MKKVVLASNNPGKIREFSELLTSSGIELIPQAALNVTEIEETGLSFIENAILKARHAAKCTGLPSLADDSGLAVTILNGAPGIYSARYAGKQANATDNIHKLLHDLEHTPNEQRQAHFHCVLVMMQHELDPTPIICDGVWHGSILREPRGQNGFGYDPIFYVPDLQKTAAELSPTIKNAISHRGLAFKALQNAIKESS